MNLALIDAIAKTVLYEGYMLYPYRPSAVKNRQRWNFGVLYPRVYSEAQLGTDAWTMQTECVVEGSAQSALEVRVRFLRLVQRSVLQLRTPTTDPDEHTESQLVEKLEVDGRVFQPWQEAVEQEVCLPPLNLGLLCLQACEQKCILPRNGEFEQVRDNREQVVAMIHRERAALDGFVRVSAEMLQDGIFKIQILIRNETTADCASGLSRDAALLQSLISAHTVMGIRAGAFVSAVDPPESLAGHIQNCRNIGAWPILVGDEQLHDTMLCSPIILYDFPKIAPESAGDLFDGTEIDEILSLRIMTLTEDEKREIRQSDERASQLLQRTETLPADQWRKLHGVLRELRPLKGEPL